MASFGELISRGRKEAGLTQKQFAELLAVSDKAVSKWERDLSLPDFDLIECISRILDIDVEILMSCNKKAVNGVWAGYVAIDNIIGQIDGKPIIHYVIMYFMLVRVKKIYVKTKQRDYWESLELEKYGIELIYDTPCQNQVIVVSNLFILFGPNLTRQLESCMGNENTELWIGSKKIPCEFYTNYGKYAETRKKNKKYFGRGYIYFEIDLNRDNLDAIEFVRIYERTHRKLADLDEVARLRGYFET